MLYAQTKDEAILKKIESFGETYVKVKPANTRIITELASFTSIDQVIDDAVIININHEEFKLLRERGYCYYHNPIYRPSDDVMCTSAGDFMNNWNSYPTWQMYDSIMYAFQDQYPSLCTTYNLNTLSSGRKLLIVKLTSSNTQNQLKPLFLYTSTMHGDETAGYILMLRLIDHLLSGYGLDPEATWILDNMEIWISPLTNPDGTYYGGDHTVTGAIRRNANNVDLNRNYPDPRIGANPDGNSYQEETVAFMGLADTVQFTVGANLHSGAEVFNYPWDTWYKPHPDNDWWIMTGRRYADTVHVNSPQGFFTFRNNGITNGAAWYIITGGRQDYMNYFAYCREVTLELSNIKILPAAQLNDMWNYHYRSLINYMKEGWYGLRGTVKDSVTGLPLKAKVWIDNHDADSSHVWSNEFSGAYFRPVYPGLYNVTWSAKGYHPVTKQVVVNNFDTTEINIKLVPENILVIEVKESNEKIWYDPVSKVIRFDNTNYPLEVLVHDITGRVIFEDILYDNHLRFDKTSSIYIVSIKNKDGSKTVKKIPVY